MEHNPALHGFRILDLTQGIPGPLATSDLGDLGARVIKVEWGSGDWSRDVGPRLPDSDAALFLACNRGKLSLLVDLADQNDWDLLSRLAHDADVIVIDWFAPQEMRDWSEQMRLLNRNLVVAELTAAPPSLQNMMPVTSEFVSQAESGLWQYQGEWYNSDTEPVRVGPDISSVWTAVALSNGIMLALYARATNGQPAERVKVSQLGATIANQTCHFSWDSNATQLHPTIGPLAPLNPPMRGFPTADLDVTISLQTSGFSDDSHLTEVFHERFGIDPAWNSVEARNTRPEERYAEYERAFQNVPSAEVLEVILELGGRGVPLNTMSSLVNHPQLLATEMIMKMPAPDNRDLTTIGFPWKFSETPAQISSGPPALGAHSKVIRQALWAASP